MYAINITVAHITGYTFYMACVQRHLLIVSLSLIINLTERNTMQIAKYLRTVIYPISHEILYPPSNYLQLANSTVFN